MNNLEHILYLKHLISKKAAHGDINSIDEEQVMKDILFNLSVREYEIVNLEKEPALTPMREPERRSVDTNMFELRNKRDNY